ncbi:PPE family protein [Nocardia spumae]|uniref:PPE family protein n=1 Tax=Nocardia spumae TaxID=2887190 RepID=UPI001D1522FB|nr:PPE domain-containing protein [Nocardia spumae]
MDPVSGLVTGVEAFAGAVGGLLSDSGSDAFATMQAAIQLTAVASAAIGAMNSLAFGALPPEVNSAQLTAGPGPAPMMATSAAYGAVAEALLAAAGGFEGSNGVMQASWQSEAGERTHNAFSKHTMWYREQAAVAQQMSDLSASAGAANGAARLAMPPLPVIVANRAAAAVLATENTLTGGATTPLLLANETAYLLMWIQAAETMEVYQTESAALVAAMPPPTVAPTIAGQGGDPPGTTYFDPPNPPPGGGGGSHGISDPGGPGGPGGGPGNGPGDGSGDMTGGHDPTTPGGSTDPTDTAVDPTQTTPGGSEAENALTNVNDTMSSMTDSLGNSGGDSSYLTEEQHGFYGTSPYSTTLMGLNGGVGSTVSFSMARGGLGAVPGSGTGFRMPANWGQLGAKAFGPLPGESGPGPMPPRNVPRGAVAPKARMRRRRDDEKKPSKVFVPGDHEEVPVLEKAPVVGVIEYADDDNAIDAVPELVPALGVLERVEDEPIPVSMDVPGEYRSRD